MAANKFPIDLKKFKVKHADEKTTILQHEHGHELKIAHSALSPAMKKQLESLKPPKMAEGGQAEKPVTLNDRIGKPFGDIKQDVPPEVQTPQKKAKGGEVQKFAEGTPDDPVSLLQNYKASETPVSAAEPAPADPMTPPPVSDEQHPNSEQLAQDIQAIQPAAANPQLAASTPTPPAQISPTLSSPPSPLDTEAGMPNAMEGYQRRQQAIEKTGEAEAAQGRAEAKTASAGAEGFRKDLEDYHNHFQELTKERNAVLQEYQKAEIKPEQYWDNHSKIKTALGLLIAGFNPTNRPNAAMELLNRQRDMDLSAQAQNMAKQHNLLAANTAQFGNLKDGMTMTRIMQNDAMAAQLKADSAKQADPIAKARALDLAGKLEQESAMQFMPFVAQRALMKRYQQQDQANSSMAAGKGVEGAKARLLPEDPALHVKLSPNASEADKTAMYKEIGARGKIADAAPKILNSFDKMAREATLTGTLAGLKDSPGYRAFRQSFLPFFQEVDGTVRAGAMDETAHNLAIKYLNSSPEMQRVQRNAVIDWMTSQSESPVSKGHGIDLDRFQKTSFDPHTLPTPQENEKIDELMKKVPSIRSIHDARAILKRSGKL